MNGWISLAILFVIKFIDNIVTTGKNILTQKNKALLASIAVIISQLMFYFVIDKVIEDKSMSTIAVVSVGAGLGSYVAFLINQKISKDRLWVHIVTSNNKTDMKVLGDYMREHNVPIITFDSYNDNLEITLTALIFANTKIQSSEVDAYLAMHDREYKRMIVD